PFFVFRSLLACSTLSLNLLMMSFSVLFCSPLKNDFSLRRLAISLLANLATVMVSINPGFASMEILNRLGILFWAIGIITGLGQSRKHLIYPSWLHLLIGQGQCLSSNLIPSAV